jgi:predicted acyl esterase
MSSARWAVHAALIAAAAAYVTVALTCAPAALARTPTPFGRLTCRPKDRVRLCRGNGSTQRVPSWDGVPLDVDVTLPPARVRAPYPTIVMLHGWPDDKTELELGGVNATPHYNNVYFARHGFAVVNYTSRGLGNSCGRHAPPAPACQRGFVRIDDQRFEARDAQYLLGLLVDEYIAKATGLGATGISYGAGRAFELAYLNNRIRCAGAYDRFKHDPCDHKRNGSFVRWRSPHGTPLRLAAAWPRFGFSDLAYALAPNGRFLDYDSATDGLDGSAHSRSPVGVPVADVIEFLYVDGLGTGYFEPPPSEPSPAWDLTGDFRALTSGGPAAIRPVVNAFRAHDSAFGLTGIPAPLLIEQGWTDDFFPLEQGLRVYNDIRAHHPGAFVAMQVGDLGHPRASNKPGLTKHDDLQGLSFFSAELEHRRHTGPANGSITAFTTTCPSVGPRQRPDGGPHNAASWPALHPGVVVLRSRRRQRVMAGSGNAKLDAIFDPINQALDPHTQGACTTVKAQTTPGTANYTLESRGFTLMGLPTVVARITIGAHRTDPGQLDARLLDVSPKGAQLLITRTGYRLDGRKGEERIVFQLHGNGYRIARGHLIKLELLGSDAPYYRRSPGAPNITIRSLTMVLPTLNRPNGAQIRAPGSVPLPAPGESGPRTTQGRLLKR